MYIDKFHFSPFKIDNNILTLWAGEVTIDGETITHEGVEITPEEFYDLFLEYARNTWFLADFIRAFEARKKAIPSSLKSFAIYCDVKVSLLGGV